MRKLLISILWIPLLLACVPDQSLKTRGPGEAVSEAGEIPPAGKEPQLVLEALHVIVPRG